MTRTRLILSKILYNSPDMLFHFSMFPKELIKEYIYGVRLSGYRKEEIQKRIDMVKLYFFDEKKFIRGVSWKI